YGSAADLADDIERHIGGFPVRARQESRSYVINRFVRRHRIGVAASVALAASLVALLVVSLRFAATTSTQSPAIAAERDVAVQVSTFLENLFEASDPYAPGADRRDTLRLAAFLEEGTRKVQNELKAQPRLQARLFTVLGKAWRNLNRYEK